MNKLISILGAGESGVGAAILAKEKGYEVFVSDYGRIKENVKNELLAKGVDFEEDGHSAEKILNSSEIIKSPGISDKMEIVKKAFEKGISVISEIEFAYRYCDGKIIAITGSNGKTTTTNLVYDIFKRAGKKVAVVGNIGTSFARVLTNKSYDYYVLELSSFQLDNIKLFKPDVSVILNITADHLDRYDYDINKYAEAKLKITMNQDKGDFFIFSIDDEITRRMAEKANPEINRLPFSYTNNEATAYVKDEKVVVNTNNTEFIMSIEELALQGKHNTYNSMAASVAARVLDIRDDFIKKSLASFKGVEHRLEKYLQIRDVQFINDSKATNINSTWYALDSIKSRVIWIAGGVDKGNDYSVLDDLVKEKVDGLVCLGLDNTKLLNHFTPFVEMITEASNMEEAVVKAFRMAGKGDAVMLSPACASFDLFENYEDRGIQFKNCVRKL